MFHLLKKSNCHETNGSANDIEKLINKNEVIEFSESADQFLQGLAMSNLVALVFHFYCPRFAPLEGLN